MGLCFFKASSHFLVGGGLGTEGVEDEGGDGGRGAEEEESHESQVTNDLFLLLLCPRADFPARIVWGGCGTLMKGEVGSLLEKWKDAV